MRQLLAVRPDFAPRLLAAHSELASLTPTVAPVFLGGGVFEKTATHIGVYGDQNPLLAWKWLESNLAPGHEFTLQLVPQLADDIFLHARILGPRTVSVPSGTYENVVEVIYAVDYGIATLLDEGEPVGYVRHFDYGTIAFSPAVGPILSKERQLRPERLLQGGFYSTAELVLAHRPPGPVPH